MSIVVIAIQVIYLITVVCLGVVTFPPVILALLLVLDEIYSKKTKVHKK